MVVGQRPSCSLFFSLSKPMMTPPSMTVVGVDWEFISTISCMALRLVRMFFSMSSTEFGTPSTPAVPTLTLTAVK